MILLVILCPGLPVSVVRKSCDIIVSLYVCIHLSLAIKILFLEKEDSYFMPVRYYRKQGC